MFTSRESVEDVFAWCCQLYVNTEDRMNRARKKDELILADDYAYQLSKLMDYINYLEPYLMRK
jgi:hypothetical protein